MEILNKDLNVKTESKKESLLRDIIMQGPASEKEIIRSINLKIAKLESMILALK